MFRSCLLLSNRFSSELFRHTALVLLSVSNCCVSPRTRLCLCVCTFVLNYVDMYLCLYSAQLEMLHPSPPTAGNGPLAHTLFGQAWSNALHKFSASALRRGWSSEHHGFQKRAFLVKMFGEGVVDNGGPYRALLVDIIAELQAFARGVSHECAGFLPLQRLVDSQSCCIYVRSRIINRAWLKQLLAHSFLADHCIVALSQFALKQQLHLELL